MLRTVACIAAPWEIAFAIFAAQHGHLATACAIAVCTVVSIIFANS